MDGRAAGAAPESPDSGAIDEGMHARTDDVHARTDDMRARTEAAARQPDGAAGADEDAVPDDVPEPHGTPGERMEQEAARPAPAEPVTAPVASSAPAPHKPPHTLGEAARLLRQGEVGPAIFSLYAVRRREPKSAEVALLLGRAYFRKLWRTDGLREYRAAIRLSPRLARDPQLVKDAVAALDDPTYALAHALLAHQVRGGALPELRRAARSAHSVRVQRRAAKLLAELAPRRRR
jgi:hypothetical protein